MSKPALLNEDQLGQNLATLNADALAPWAVADGKLSRRYEFSNFIDAFGFMTQAAIACEVMSHHPRWVNVWNVVEIDLLTHRSGGITPLDFELAGKMEVLAKKLLA
ncbi:MAG: 4a-hydroxytetrahydrobiopterin dehydratase [Gammaproteobacteria bacterium]|nr:4a-hydroxytetrahydrobiopterin dehydratase [Gammaproteobacteria bacterium]MBQ0840279.1 4a-hydroxytetrahydrobiopterin dehydratase [Gammaproteobacteria bacterium]